MLHRHRIVLSVLVIVIVVWMLTGCATQVVTVTVTTPPETVVVTATPLQSLLAVPPGDKPKTLTVCLVGEPDTLYLYGGSRLSATRHVMEALYDGPVDYVNYTYQPVILEKMPDVADGDAITRSIRVREGILVMDTTGNVVPLEEGVRVRPTGCYSDECAVEFTGESVWMERMEVTFVLRQDVTWSDGEPLTAHDSVFAYQVASDPVTPGRRYLAERTARYRALDDWRVQWVGVPGFLPQTYFLNFFVPLPRHQLEEYEPDQLLVADGTRRSPLGWGPFVVADWVTGDHITLVRNPYYFRAGEGLPHLDRVVFRFASGAPDVMARLLSGECDIGTQDADLESSFALLIEAEQKGLLQVYTATNNAWEHIDFGISPAEDYRQVDFFDNVAVRQAIIQCIDRQAIVDEVTYGRSVVPDSYLPPSHPLYAGVYLVHWGYNPEMGRTMLEEIGWLDQDTDGVREAYRIPGIPSGTPFEVSLLVPSDKPFSLQAARIIKANLADCGIRVQVEAQPSWALFADGPDGPLFGRRFDLAETSWWFDITPLCGHYIRAEIPQEGRWYGSNITGYSNPEYDAVCQRALQSLPGSPAYQEYHREAQILFSEELPAIPLFMGLRIAATRSSVHNFGLESTAASELWNIEMLDVDEE